MRHVRGACLTYNSFMWSVYANIVQYYRNTYYIPTHFLSVPPLGHYAYILRLFSRKTLTDTMTNTDNYRMVQVYMRSIDWQPTPPPASSLRPYTTLTKQMTETHRTTSYKRAPESPSAATDDTFPRAPNETPNTDRNDGDDATHPSTIRPIDTAIATYFFTY